MYSINKLSSDNDTIFEIIADKKDQPSIERQFFKHTKRDIEIHNLPIPQRPVWLWLVIKVIRLYQKRISPQLGNRCVFDPSCSRYSELAFRNKGFFKGVYFTIRRLFLC